MVHHSVPVLFKTIPPACLIVKTFSATEWGVAIGAIHPKIISQRRLSTNTRWKLWVADRLQILPRFAPIPQVTSKNINNLAGLADDLDSHDAPALM
jgi:hypothetical protein